MRCASCGVDNTQGANFCEECGAQFVRICPSRGQHVRPTAEFCPDCGTPLMTGGGQQACATSKTAKRRAAHDTQGSAKPQKPSAHRGSREAGRRASEEKPTPSTQEQSAAAPPDSTVLDDTIIPRPQTRAPQTSHSDTVM